ncbi:hypothetical protein L1049_019418 [Liquidambar formosana]|uniref:PGG domain-containing protein n=1 Tax=Liquidambar formosana TaxID=63359 RepID=A0AAP0SBL8_LIQFO
MVTTNLALLGIVPEELREDNYEYWKACLKTYLIGQGLWDVVSPTGTKLAHESWERQNAMALHAIQISCGPNVVSKIRETESAKIAWEYLAEKHRLPPPSPHEEGPEEKRAVGFVQYESLFKAVDRGNWEDTIALLQNIPNALQAKISATDDTALHVAILAGHVKIVDELVNLMSAEDLELKNKFGATALSTIAISGNTKMAEAMVEKNPRLLSIKDDRGHIPVVVAALYGQKDMVRYLYPMTPHVELTPKKSGPTLLNCLITAEIYDIALLLMQQQQHNPQLAFTEDLYRNYTIRLLAQKPSAFPCGSKLVLWKQWIYSSDLLRELVWNISLFFGTYFFFIQQNAFNITLINNLCINFFSVTIPIIKRIYERKLMHVEAVELLDCIFKEIPNLSEKQFKTIGIDEAIYDAIKHGIIEFIEKIIEYDPDTIWRKGVKGRTMFAHAIILRQEKIFNMIYGLGPTRKSIIARRRDIFGNNILHLAGKLAPSSQLDRVSGAALQMQRELQWFKEVESIVKPKSKEDVNENDKTPSTLFSDEHADLVKKGERWMKNTATSCMVVATLIAALMFTTAFTVPGGTDNDTGIPIFIWYNAFMVFIAADCIVAILFINFSVDVLRDPHIALC